MYCSVINMIDSIGFGMYGCIVCVSGNGSSIWISDVVFFCFICGWSCVVGRFVMVVWVGRGC